MGLTDTKVWRERFLQSSGAATDVLIGLSDGLVLPFALAAALSAVVESSALVLVACLAESLLIALALGYAAYQTVVNQAEEDLDPEQWAQLPAKPGAVSHLRLRSILGRLDMPPDILEKADEETLRYRMHWNSLLAEYGLGLPLPDFRRARRNGWRVGLTFFAAALACLLPYFFWAAPVALRCTAAITLTLLLVFGYTKAAYLGQPRWREALRSVLTGLLAALAVYLVGRLFRP